MKLVMAKIESANIDQIGYDSETSILAVTFKGRETPGLASIYLYAGVPQDVATALTSSQSAGSYLATNIKGRYNYSKLDLTIPLTIQQPVLVKEEHGKEKSN
jgi:hypothetical protein